MSKFIILSTARSGSTYLRDLLNSHEDITCHGELFTDQEGQGLNGVLQGKGTEGVKVFYYHEIDWNSVSPDIKVIHLIRRNDIKRFVSLKIARKTDNWNSPLPNKDEKEIYFDIDEYERNRRYIERCRLNAILKLHDAGNDIYNLFYSDVSSKNLSELLSFLGVEDKPMQSYLIQQNPEPISDLISNYSEVEEYINENTNLHNNVR